MKKRTLFTTLAACAVAVAATFGVADIATADDVSAENGSKFITVSINQKTRGTFYYWDNGDKFVIHDNYTDGYGVGGYILDSNRELLKVVYNRQGAGTDKNFSYDIKSGRTYYMMVCSVDGGQSEPVKCESTRLTE